MGGTEDLTALDIHIAPFWEMIFLYERGTYANVDEVLKIRENAPNWCAYVEKFRNHPLIKPHRYNAKASEAQALGRALGPLKRSASSALLFSRARSLTQIEIDSIRHLK